MDAVEVGFNPFDPAFAADPYPQWAALREHDPVHLTPFETWILLRHDDVLRFIRDPATSVEDRNATPTALTQAMADAIGDGAGAEMGSRAMLNLDPPDHTRLRRLVTSAFTPRVVERLRPRVQELVDDALDRVAPTGRMELVGDLAFQLPFAVISEMLGMPEADTRQLRDWSGLMVRRLEPVVAPDLLGEIVAAGAQMQEYTAGVIAWKRQNMGDDLLSALIAAEDAGDGLSDEELVDQVVLLYIAGHETTVNLIGNGILALLRNPDQLRRLRDDPSLDANATEELLRFDSPVQMTRRITLADTEVGGKVIPAGAFVVCALASANRDEARWGADAGRLDVGRADASRHLAFGGGTHYCLGAALARLEGQVAVGSLLRRFPGLEQADEPVWNGRINLRGLERLDLALVP